MTEEHTPSAYVAFLDILGYKQIVKGNTHEGLKKFYFNEMSAITAFKSFPHKVIHVDGKSQVFGNGKPVNVKSIMVSDSMILWTPDDSVESFQDIIYKVMHILEESIWKGMPMRCGVSVGPVSSYVEEDNQMALLGRPIVEAYELQECQDWMGCTIQESVMEKYLNPKGNFGKLTEELISNKVLIEYKVPMKSGSVKKHFAVNWMLCGRWSEYFRKIERNSTVEELIRGSFSSQNKESNNWEVERKIQNTLEFIKEVTGVDINKKYWPFPPHISSK